MADSAEVAVALVAAVPREDGDMKAEDFLTGEEQQRVSDAVQMAERKTSGEIVPMIVSSSHGYPLAAILGGLVFSLPVALFITHYWGGNLWLGQDNVWLFLGLFSVLFGASLIPLRANGRLKALFLYKPQVDHEVREAALAAFYTEKLYKTEKENGILLYISLLERRVWVLADAGITSKIPQERWDDIVAELTSDIRTGKQCAGICKAVTAVGQILEEHFPGEKDDQNELHNLIIRS